MERLDLPERPDWRETAQAQGFTFAHMHGAPYWDETSCYAFGLAEIEREIEGPASELHAMCREAIPRILASEALLERLCIPPEHRDLVAASWAADEPSLYGRMDLAYDGQGPAKLLEYNADTPTALYESAAFQWQWLEEQIAAGVLRPQDDQFNGLHEALVARFGALFAKGTDLHFAAAAGNAEDYATVEQLGWAAREAGLGAHYTDLEAIGLTADGQFVDAQDRVIGTLFKLYPWEDLMRDSYGPHLAGSGCRFLEPPWKALLSNKGLLPVLWEMFEGHPNLLPAVFEADRAAAPPATAQRLAEGHVRKPVFSREGASVEIFEAGRRTEGAEGAYDAHPRVLQAYHPLPVFGGARPVIGAWIVGEDCVGMGLREDDGRITQDLSRFKPHIIRD